MSVQELNRVHRRYIQISNSFKSAWTFHQFVQGLRKVFLELEGETINYSADFQQVYAQLKEISKDLTAVTVEQAKTQLEEAEAGLAPLAQALLAADEQIAPGLLRQFFQRVKSYDDNILAQLVKFYLYFDEGDRDEGDRDERDRDGSGGWSPDRLDKADYLSTKISEEYDESRDVFVLRDRTHVREVAQGFWTALDATPIAEVETAVLCRQIAEMRREIADAASIDALHEKHLVQRYRDLKHHLGKAFFEPKIFQEIAETNLVLKNHVQQLYRRDEQRIVAEYQQVFDLEREAPVDFELKEELDEFRQVVDRVEGQLQGDNLRLSDLAQLRERVRGLMPKLQPGSGEEGAPDDASETAEQPRAWMDADLESEFQAVIEALDTTKSMDEPRKAVFQPELFSLGIEAREVVAYRRLFTEGGGDEEVERFLLRAAALRVRIEREVDEIKGILDDTAVTREAPVFAKARGTVRKGDQFLRWFDHLLEMAVVDGEADDARSIQVLKMRLMRAFSGLWLMIHKL